MANLYVTFFSLQTLFCQLGIKYFIEKTEDAIVYSLSPMSWLSHEIVFWWWLLNNYKKFALTLFYLVHKVLLVKHIWVKGFV